MSNHWSETHRPHYVDGDPHNMKLVPKASWNSSMEKDNRIAKLERQAQKLLDGLSKYRGQINIDGVNSATDDIDKAMEEDSQ